MSSKQLCAPQNLLVFTVTNHSCNNYSSLKLNSLSFHFQKEKSEKEKTNRRNRDAPSVSTYQFFSFSHYHVSPYLGSSAMPSHPTLPIKILGFDWGRDCERSIPSPSSNGFGANCLIQIFYQPSIVISSRFEDLIRAPLLSTSFATWSEVPLGS